MAEEDGRSLAPARPPRRRLFADIALGLRVGDFPAVGWAVANESVDFVVLDASRLRPNSPPPGWPNRRTRLLIDPNTDLLARDDRPLLTFRGRVAGDFGWRPDPIGPALLKGTDDARLVGSVLDWQRREGVDGLITPYIRVEDWSRAKRPVPLHLDRAEAIVTAAAAHERAGRLPLLGAVALYKEAVRDPGRRQAVVDRLGRIEGIDGLYVVAQAPTTDPPWHRRGWLSALKSLGDAIHAAGLQSVLAYGGPELVPLLASGAWDAGVTGATRSARYPTFRTQNGQPTSVVATDRLFAAAVLDEVPVTTLAFVAGRDRSLVACGCDACSRLVAASGALSFAPDRARQHYLAAMARWVAWLRRTPPAGRFSALERRFATIASAAEAAERGMGFASMRTRERFEFWASQLA